MDFSRKLLSFLSSVKQKLLLLSSPLLEKPFSLLVMTLIGLLRDTEV
ncbi:hypothetical protein C5167_006671 [Papaver somniferum]|uniref:Uncharacterized protein n=1 Tax=Papaver somniferum TaxID=3469 RepID=A0A4Y7JHZ0_PAPSO|nr:hypothetical protein C5167_006671 [Papaver somniferum]